MSSSNKSGGFTLIEILVVVAITVFISGFLITTFSKTRVALDSAAAEIRAALREAQANALSGVPFGGGPRCGYGVHFNTTDYIIYAGAPTNALIPCASQNRDYEEGTDNDAIVRTILLPSTNIEIVTSVFAPLGDVFFESPNPTTFISNASTPGGSIVITVRKRNAVCPSTDCRTITVTVAGRIQSP